MLLIGSLVAACWFAVFVVAHVVTFARFPVRNRSTVILLLYGLTFAGAVASAIFVSSADFLAGVASPSHRLLAVTAAALVMGCAFMLYMPFYYTITSSLSIQTVIAIDEAPGQRIALDVLASPATYEPIVLGRLESMVVAGHLRRDDDRYIATPKGRTIARFFGWLKQFWRLGPGG